MKELVFNTDSWHYKFAKWGGYNQNLHGSDICAYTRRVLLSFFFAALIFLGIVVAAFAVVDIVFGLIFSIIAGAWIMGEVGSFTLVVVSIIMVLVGCFCLSEYIKEKRCEARERRYNKNRNKVVEDSFLIHAYKSWKEKYCVKIKFVGKTEEEKEDHWCGM